MKQVTTGKAASPVRVSFRQRVDLPIFMLGGSTVPLRSWPPATIACGFKSLYHLEFLLLPVHGDVCHVELRLWLFNFTLLLKRYFICHCHVFQMGLRDDGVGPHQMNQRCWLDQNVNVLPRSSCLILSLGNRFSLSSFYQWKVGGLVVSGDLPKIAHLSNGR